ncbi:hypothetical protein [Maribellus mangrovi]|uniref:hypothetical protein n=1 Tax=Maribellus mangrovi TaxID=3133146 RepID=UPI0030ECDA16
MAIKKYELEDLNDCLKTLAENLKGDDYRRKVRGSLKEESEELKQEIFDACYRVAEVLDMSSKELRDLSKKLNRNANLRDKLEDEYMDRKSAREYTNLPESTFDKKASDFKEIINGRPKYKVGDLNKIMRAIVSSSESTLCINTYYYFERNINAYIKFEGGQYYKIVEETEGVLLIYNERHNISVQIPKKFAVNFRRKEDLSF